MANELKGALDGIKKEISDSASFVAEYNELGFNKVADAIDKNFSNLNLKLEQTFQALPKVIEEIIVNSPIANQQVANQPVPVNNIPQLVDKSNPLPVETVGVKDPSGREKEPMTQDSTEKAVGDGVKKGLGGYFKNLIGSISSLSNSIGGWMKGVGSKAFDKAGSLFKNIMNDIAEIAIVVAAIVAGFSFFKGWQKATEWFGENADLGQKLASALAQIVGSFLGMDEEGTKNLAMKIAGIFQSIKDTFQFIVDKIGLVPTLLLGAATLLLGPSGIMGLVGVFMKVGGLFFSAFGTLMTAIVPILSSIGTFITGTLLPALTPFLSTFALVAAGAAALYTVIQGVVDGFNNAIKVYKESGSVWEAVKAFFSGFADSVVSTLTKAKDFVVEGFKKMLGGLIDFVNSFIKYIPKVPYIPNPYAETSAPAKVTPPEQSSGNTDARAVAKTSAENNATKQTTTTTQQKSPVAVVQTNVSNTANTTAIATNFRPRLNFSGYHDGAAAVP